jgi:hypothetical protein
LKKKVYATALFLIFIVGVVIYKNTNEKRIEEIAGFQRTEVTKISFQYSNPAIKGGTVEDKERIKEFMNYIDSCVLLKKHPQTPINGYSQLAVFYIGDDRVMDIMTYGDFVDINGTQYDMVKNKLSIDKIDEFIKSIK